MPTVDDMIENLASFQVRKEATAAIKKNAGAMVLLNLSQLNVGEDINGEHFREYAPWQYETGEDYADVKHEMNPKPGWGNPDLRFTGNFYKGFYVEIDGNDIIMDSRDEKSQILQEMYPADPTTGTTLDYDRDSLIFGLQDKNHELFLFDVTFPDFAQMFQEATGLKIK